MKNMFFCIVLVSAILGCESQVRVKDSRGGYTVMEDPKTRGGLSGVGVESQDIVGVTDKMARDILSNAAIVRHPTPPRIVIDSSNFKNASSTIINKDMFTDRLRVELSRAANGKIVFIARHLAEMTEKEWALEESGIVSEGTQGETKQALGYDYRLGGRIASIDMADPKTGALSRYHQITFELVERGSGVIVWSGIYEFKKTSQDDIVYR